MIKPITEKIKEAIEQAYPEAKVTDFGVRASDNEAHGDYASSIAMQLAQELGQNPKEIAENIIATIGHDEMFAKIEVAGSGFINFYLSSDFVQKQVTEILAKNDHYATSKIGSDKKVQVEFISANPTGPITIGNGRGGFLGDALANILASQGFQVEREYYVNDSGRQVKILGDSILAFKGLAKPEEYYRGDYVADLAAKVEKQIPVDKNSDPKKLGQIAAQILMDESIKKDVADWGIKYDVFFSEQSLYDNGALDDVLAKLKEKKLLFDKDNALFMRTTEFGDDKDRVLRKSDGDYTYFTTDIAYHLDKFEKRHFDLSIDIWGGDHGGYVGRMTAAMKAFGLDNRLKIIVMQLVRLIENGQEVRMSKRRGVYVLLSDLVKEVGLDVTKFFFLMHSANTHMDFDLNLAKEKSSKNPVYYVQYANARICSILSKAQVASSKVQVNFSVLRDKNELKLIKELIKYPDLLAEIASDYQAQKLPYYLIHLTEKFHQFYENCRVIGEEKELEKARLALIQATQQVLQNGLMNLGISAPEKM